MSDADTSMTQKQCAHRRCRRKVMQAFDVGSWWSKSVFHSESAELVHYEVCDRHAAMFAHPFDRSQSEAVERDCVPWRPAVPPRGGMSTEPLAAREQR